MIRRNSLKVVLSTLAILAMAGTAWAYWTTHGSGTATASVATLTAPANVASSASAGSQTVSVNWTGSTLSDGTSAQGYYVFALPKN